MDKKKFEKLEFGFYGMFVVIVILTVSLKNVIHDEFVYRVLMFVFLILFAITHMLKFNIYKNTIFAKKHRLLWIIINLAAMTVICQTLLLFLELIRLKDLTIPLSICLVGDILIDIVMEPEKNETSD
jgi:hypothetical protein